MNKQHSLHLKMIQKVARHLGPLREKVVFLGGCATGFLITDPAAADIRPTKDVDLIVEVASRVEYHRLEDELRNLGFVQKFEQDSPICRWVVDDVLVDVMPTEENILGFSNRWYLSAINSSSILKIGDNLEIRMVLAPYFIASKIEAFHGRGKNDYLLSHDLEDIINVIDGRLELIAEIKKSPPELKNFLSSVFKEFINDEHFLNSLPGHLLPDPASQSRLPILMRRIKEIAGLDA